jgi:hypothetical protein
VPRAGTLALILPLVVMTCFLSQRISADGTDERATLRTVGYVPMTGER